MDGAAKQDIGDKVAAGSGAGQKIVLFSGG
jgi:hypothetical protein